MLNIEVSNLGSCGSGGRGSMGARSIFVSSGNDTRDIVLIYLRERRFFEELCIRKRVLEKSNINGRSFCLLEYRIEGNN